MSVKSLSTMLACLAMLVASVAFPRLATADPAPPPNHGVCVVDVSGGSFTGTQGTQASGSCPGGSGSSGTAAPPTKLVDCGRASVHDVRPWNPDCGPVRRDCVRTDPATGATTRVDAFATLTLRNGKWGDPQVWCPSDPQPAVAMAGIREQAIRLLPPVPVGKASTSPALVNTQTLFWVASGTHRALPTARVVGQAVQLRIAFAHADWDFGDGTTDTTTDPGKTYDRVNDRCNTAQCPGYYGHTYTSTGRVAITLRVTWTVQFRIAGGNWTDLPAPLTGPQTTARLHLYQARGVLVQDPP